MAAVQAGSEEVLPLLAGREHEIDLAAVNGPAAVVVAGDARRRHGTGRALRELGRAAKQLKVRHAFHSPHMDGMLARFETVGRGLNYRARGFPSCRT